MRSQQRNCVNSLTVFSKEKANYADPISGESMHDQMTNSLQMAHGSSTAYSATYGTAKISNKYLLKISW